MKRIELSVVVYGELDGEEAAELASNYLSNIFEDERVTETEVELQYEMIVPDEKDFAQPLF